ncbi:MAG: Plug domain-containing protein, partial [Bacteroidota bacterium]|nr:Plug domain-containing protein [Bacteroidota bacterium]
LLPLDKRLYSSFIALPDYLPEGVYTLQAYSERMAGKRSHAYFTRKIQISNPVRKYKPANESISSGPVVRFYPEGGSLLENQTSEVVFTANEADGRPCTVRGEVYKNTGEQVAVLKTLEPGIGRFSLPVGRGCSYFALIRNGHDPVVQADLPPVKAGGYDLKVLDLIDSWYVTVQQADVDKITGKFTVLVLLRGVPQYHFELTPDNDFLQLPKTLLKSGVHELVLMDAQNKVLSERLIFSNNKDQAIVNWSMKSDSSSVLPATGQLLSLDLTVTDSDGVPLKAEFSVSAFREDSVAACPAASIASDFLLTSDLNQAPANPDRFFNKQDAISQGLLDTWLMASTWPKFELQKAIDGKLESSWDIGETDNQTVLSEKNGIYGPLTAEEMAERNEILKTINLKEVNVTAQQLDRQIKPYSYANHSISGKDLVEQGLTMKDYLINLPGVNWDDETETLSIRNGTVTFLLDGVMVDAGVLNNVPATDIESVDVLKDPGNMGLIKFSTSDSTLTAIGGVVAIWTKLAYDVKPKSSKVVLPAGKKIDEDVRHMMMPGTKDTWMSQFPNPSRSNLWKPCVLTDEQGRASLKLVVPDGNGNLIIEISGVASDGSLVSHRIDLGKFSNSL